MVGVCQMAVIAKRLMFSWHLVALTKQQSVHLSKFKSTYLKIKKNMPGIFLKNQNTKYFLPKLWSFDIHII
jgi:hypothetical protein